MGLDIEVIKPIRATPALIKKHIEDTLPNKYKSCSITLNESLKRFMNLSFKKEVEYIDFVATFKSLGLNLDDYTCGMSSENGYHFMLNSNILPGVSISSLCDEDDSTYGYDLVVGYEMLKTYLEEEDWIIGECVGYQRKGANKLFYKNEDGVNMWNHPPIVEKSVLIEHWEKYFSHSTPNAPGGFGDSVEYNDPDSVMKQNFKRNIIDKFKEGDTYVIYC